MTFVHLLRVLDQHGANECYIQHSVRPQMFLVIVVGVPGDRRPVGSSHATF